MTEVIGRRRLLDDHESTHAGAIIVNPNGKIPLALQSKNSRWSLPKGKRENEETEQQTLSREVEEETGITNVAIVRKIGNIARYSFGRDETHVMAYFLCKTIAVEPLEPKGIDIQTGEWFTPHSARRHLHNPADYDILESVMEEIDMVALNLSIER